MKRDVLFLIRSLVMMAALMLFAITVGLYLDVARSGFSTDKLSTFKYTEARFLADVTNRGLNQVLAIAFTVVAIAVPLTANLYSLKFLEFFIKDPVNATVLTLVVFADVASASVVYALKEDLTPYIQLHFSFALLVLCLAILFPYLYYIFRFLHPNTLLERLEDEINDNLRQAVHQPKKSAHYRKQVAEGIEHIANIAIRSVDRSDRNTAIESVHTLERVAHAYWLVKKQMSHGWFDAEQSLFLGFSSKAVDEICRSHTWVEMKLFSQLRQVMSAAVPKMHDLVSAIAKTLRRLGQGETARHDAALREMAADYFNTFIRLAIVRKDARSVFTLFDQYRTYAESLNADYPEMVQEIAFYFEYYGQVARENGLTFIVESVAHDLGTLVQHAYQYNARNQHKLLERFLQYDFKARPPLPGVKKAHALLASYLLLAGHTEESAQIGQSFAGLDPAFVYTIKDDLLHIKREKYWEINERRMNMDYVPDDQREKLHEFFEGLKRAEAGT